MRHTTHALALVLLLFAAASAQHGRLPIPLPTPAPKPTPNGENAPTMKKPDHVAAAPSHPHRSYDAAHDATYVNIDIPLVSHTERKLSATALAFEGRDVFLTFQLAYRGKHNDDLVAAYIVIESTSAPDAKAPALDGARRLEVRADAYEYAYDLTDYKAGTADQTGATQKNAPALRREIAIFRIEPDDLLQIAPANRVELKLGTEEFTVKSPQLTELRRTLATGDKP
ncbi:MAG: hypothetical protein LC746_06030 [Acidobacteria bacterium]|nr:hypothetical protein [Acidobacteriota bacterium]